ncbi:hypothetical protein [Cytobacillus sp. IB215665]|uniref:hypothetical protein n=1 Tax=Cytobacillus sp. IB215665 TaxID=3097357 RepID=UPI002A16A526|nr:hypothetical protein [Cytobacillus sp. IB215665]MDX8367870.1 hypothetical protein [Cytobacillus sp. IB215665]
MLTSEEKAVLTKLLNEQPKRKRRSSERTRDELGRFLPEQEHSEAKEEELKSRSFKVRKVKGTNSYEVVDSFFSKEEKDAIKAIGILILMAWIF